MSLKAKVAGGIAWNLLTQVIGLGSRLAVGIVLARLLTPHQFGIAGMALVFTNLLTLFTDVALGAALIQRAELSEADRSTVFWVTVGLGLTFSAIAVALSGTVAAFFGQPEVAPLFAALAASFFLNALSSVQTALATRELAYRRLQIREITAVLTGAAVGVVAAAGGLGAWAIVLQSIAISAVSAVLIWSLSPWRPKWVFSRDSLHDLGTFGAKLFGSRILGYINLNGDNLLVGRFLGSSALGIYSLAYNVMFTPMIRIGLPFQQVVFPAYSRLQSDPARLAAAWVRTKRLSVSLLAPGFVAFLVVAPDLVPVVFGAKWHGAVLVLQLLCVAGVGHAFVTLNWSVLQARGQAGVLLALNLVSTTVIFTAFAVGLNWGVAGVAGGYAIAKWLLVLPDTWVTSRALGLRPLRSLRAGGVAVPIAATAGLIAYALRLVLVNAGTSAPVRLVIVLVAGGAIYLALVWLVAPALVRELRGLRGLLGAGNGAQRGADVA